MIVLSLIKDADGVETHLRERFGSRSTPSPGDTILALAWNIGKVIEDNLPEGITLGESIDYWKEKVCMVMEASAKGKDRVSMET